MSDPQGKTRINPEIATPSNAITIVRILLVPVFVGVMLAPWPAWFGLSDTFSNNWKSIIAALVFVVISGTDWLDGYLARSRNEVTDFGKFMDPLADKILVAAALIALVELGDLPTWVVLIILAREFIVSGARMMAASKGQVIAASMIGKFKTVFQMIAIVLFSIKRSYALDSLGDAFNDTLWLISWAVMLIALGLTIASMVDYLNKSREAIGLSAPSSAQGDACDSAGGNADLNTLARERAAAVVKYATEHEMTLSTAESLTGGLIGAVVTSVPGASAVYKGAVVSYVNEVKHGQLDVSETALAEVGAVSQEVALQMAAGVRQKLSTTVSVSVTGLAGPDGDDYGNPVGTVWMGISSAQSTRAVKRVFDGGRDAVRLKTVVGALELVLEEMRACTRQKRDIER